MAWFKQRFDGITLVRVLNATVPPDAEQITLEILHCQLCSYTTYPSTLHILRMRLNFLSSTETWERSPNSLFDFSIKTH